MSHAEIKQQWIYMESYRKRYPVMKQRKLFDCRMCEPAVSNDHFGNTDCANVDLALPFFPSVER